MTEIKQIRLTITGRVQGVFFRKETQRMAQKLNLKGYVKNLPTGSVEAVFQGDPGALAQMSEWCSHGPSFASVTSVETENETRVSDFKSFEIRY